ncbi:nitrogen regulation protein NR(II) [Desulforhopalus sp. IMCC35007]|uniref:two-component system sensor histidine kinase NtrB n=1 Tax=Desulforhopalus sp. IMCC35007 TaxID=2569543 RepID=UPI0010AE2D5B|nr:ATP-binding protein [Desulforhopalus sp. IMCC35007]TKB11316.1 PAS domain-containing protein [Desulforhopalus sp. IMCC35007]
MQDNLILNAPKTFAISKPAVILLVISAMLIGILVIATIKNRDRSQKLMELSFMRQGKTMIHAFEAGTRTSMMFRKSAGHNPLEDLAIEVLKDKGIAFIRIIDEDNAVVVSQGNISQAILKNFPDLKEVGDSPVFSISWPDNIFQISQKFNPVTTSMHGMSMMESRWEQWNLAFKPKGQMYISVGFYTSEYEKTKQQDMYHTIFMLVMLLLLFFAGLYFLYLYQRMGVTHATLLNTQLYTNNVLESIPDSLITLDQAGYIVSCNRNAEKLFERRPNDIIGKKVLDIFPACPPETLTTQSNVIEKDAELEVPNSESIPIKIGSAQLKDHLGNKIGRVLVIRDVGEIRSMEKQLEHSRRLAALGAMAAGIAHEVRNPLGTLRGLAHFFGSEDGASDACREYSKFMISEVDRLNHLVTELLQFGAPRELNFEKIDIKAMVGKTVALLEQDFVEKRISLVHKYDESTELYGDTDLLIQTLMNLLKNSIQATPPGGQVSLNISCDKEMCRISVSDTGSGMSEETKSRMFDPFYTTKKSGTGLGLAVSHRIVERHNGYFEINSVVNAGTTITIVLPLKERT